MKKVIRITRHEVDTARQMALYAIYGIDVQIVTTDIPYGDDPVAAVKQLISSQEEGGDTVVAVEAIAPLPSLMKLVDRRRDLGVALIRATFQRDEGGGRAIVTGKDAGGRDILAFGGYEELLRIEFETRPLG